MNLSFPADSIAWQPLFCKSDFFSQNLKKKQGCSLDRFFSIKGQPPEGHQSVERSLDFFFEAGASIPGSHGSIPAMPSMPSAPNQDDWMTWMFWDVGRIACPQVHPW